MSGARDAARPPRERMVIVGPGRAGTSLARAWRDAGHEIAALVGGGAAALAAARAELGAIPAAPSSSATAPGVLVVLAVPDDALPAAAAALGGPHDAATLVVHLAGGSGLDVLAAAAARGVRVAAFHPLRAFATRAAGRDGLCGAAVAIEAADPATHARLAALATEIGGRPFALAGAARDLYHAAAAIAGNAPLALLDVAERAFVAAGAPPETARAALATLAAGAVDNAARLGPATALTGPVVRGDAGVVARHLAALGRRDPAERALYAALCEALVRLAATRPDGAKASAVADLLAAERARAAKPPPRDGT